MPRLIRAMDGRTLGSTADVVRVALPLSLDRGRRRGSATHALEELSEVYADKMTVYKIDTDAEQELAAVFGIQSIPSMLFIPVDDKPQMAVGALPKDSIKQAMKDVLSVE